MEWQEINSKEIKPSRGEMIGAIQEVEQQIHELEGSGFSRDPAPPNVTYALGTTGSKIERMAGTVTAGAATMTGTTARVTWTRVGPTGLRRKREISQDKGTTWTTVWTDELLRTQ